MRTLMGSPWSFEISVTENHLQTGRTNSCFCRPSPNTCHSSVKPVLVNVLWDMHTVQSVHSLRDGVKGDS